MKNCPQEAFESTMNLLTKQNLTEKSVDANKLALVNKIIELQCGLEDIQRNAHNSVSSGEKKYD